jgi:hypothetical protein
MTALVNREVLFLLPFNRRNQMRKILYMEPPLEYVLLLYFALHKRIIFGSYDVVELSQCCCQVVTLRS